MQPTYYGAICGSDSNMGAARHLVSKGWYNTVLSCYNALHFNTDLDTYIGHVVVVAMLPNLYSLINF